MAYKSGLPDFLALGEPWMIKTIEA